MNKLEKIMDLFKIMKDGKEVLSYSLHDEEENYDEFIGFNINEDTFYKRTISDDEEPKTTNISIRGMLSCMENLFDTLDNTIKM